MKFFVPYMRLPIAGEPYGSLKQIKEAGWDGIEIHLIGEMRKQSCLAQVVMVASELGLEYRFHQGWSWRTGQRNWANVALRALGSLVPNDEPLQEQVRNAMIFGGPVVAYGNHLAPNPRVNQAGCVFQTACEHVDGRAYAMPYLEFAERLRAVPKAPIALDTQHLLEWTNDLPTVVGLRSFGSFGPLRDFVEEFGPRIAEIHWNNARPELGANRGRNVIPAPGGGIIFLTEFARFLRQVRWDGIVVPEVNRLYLGKGEDQIGLAGLRELMHVYW